MLKKVLIVEDRIRQQGDYAAALMGKVNLLQAFSVAEAERLFKDNPDIELVVLDACVPGDSPNTMPLALKFRETFAGPMLAASSMDIFRAKLMKAGCSHDVEKKDVPALVLRLLGIADDAAA